MPWSGRPPAGAPTSLVAVRCRRGPGMLAAWMWWMWPGGRDPGGRPFLVGCRRMRGCTEKDEASVCGLEAIDPLMERDRLAQLVRAIVTPAPEAEVRQYDVDGKVLQMRSGTRCWRQRRSQWQVPFGVTKAEVSAAPSAGRGRMVGTDDGASAASSGSTPAWLTRWWWYSTSAHRSSRTAASTAGRRSRSATGNSLLPPCL
jgi:hypothetical protein